MIHDAAADRAAAARVKVLGALGQRLGGVSGGVPSGALSKAARSKALAAVAAADPEGWTISSRHRQAAYHPHLFTEAER